MIDFYFDRVLAILAYTVRFIFWVFRAFFVTITAMSNSRRR